MSKKGRPIKITNSQRAQDVIDHFVGDTNMISPSGIVLLKEEIINQLEDAEARGYNWHRMRMRRKRYRVQA